MTDDRERSVHNPRDCSARAMLSQRQQQQLAAINSVTSRSPRATKESMPTEAEWPQEQPAAAATRGRRASKELMLTERKERLDGLVITAEDYGYTERHLSPRQRHYNAMARVDAEQAKQFGLQAAPFGLHGFGERPTAQTARDHYDGRPREAHDDSRQPAQPVAARASHDKREDDAGRCGAPPPHLNRLVAAVAAAGCPRARSNPAHTDHAHAHRRTHTHTHGHPPTRPPALRRTLVSELCTGRSALWPPPLGPASPSASPRCVHRNKPRNRRARPRDSGYGGGTPRQPAYPSRGTLEHYSSMAPWATDDSLAHAHSEARAYGMSGRGRSPERRSPQQRLGSPGFSFGAEAVRMARHEAADEAWHEVRDGTRKRAGGEARQEAWGGARGGVSAEVREDVREEAVAWQHEARHLAGTMAHDRGAAHDPSTGGGGMGGGGMAEGGAAAPRHEDRHEAAHADEEDLAHLARSERRSQGVQRRPPAAAAGGQAAATTRPPQPQPQPQPQQPESRFTPATAPRPPEPPEPPMPQGSAEVPPRSPRSGGRGARGPERPRPPGEWPTGGGVAWLVTGNTATTPQDPPPALRAQQLARMTQHGASPEELQPNFTRRRGVDHQEGAGLGLTNPAARTDDTWEVPAALAPPSLPRTTLPPSHHPPALAPPSRPRTPPSTPPSLPLLLGASGAKDVRPQEGDAPLPAPCPRQAAQVQELREAHAQLDPSRRGGGGDTGEALRPQAPRRLCARQRATRVV